MCDDLINYIQELYKSKDFIPLHEPRFIGNEKNYLNECIDSTFVSSVGKFVDEFEKRICEYTGAKHAVAVTNGTSALHLSLVLAGVEKGDEVLTQALTFVATANAISYQHADPVFIDSAKDNLGMCPEDLKNFLENNCEKKQDGFTYNKKTGKRIKACLPMHTFGHAVDIDKIQEICFSHNIFLIEDAAEALGSYSKDRHLGTIAELGVLSFNGNKVITCGGGGVILIKDAEVAKRAKHLSTTAKIPHQWEFDHSEIAFNYRLPNLNAALACAQLEKLDSFLENKRETAQKYKKYFQKESWEFVDEPLGCKSNFWLNAFMVNDLSERNEVLEKMNASGVMTRPLWKLMSDLVPFRDCQKTNLKNAQMYYERVVNIPSSVRVL